MIISLIVSVLIAVGIIWFGVWGINNDDELWGDRSRRIGLRKLKDSKIDEDLNNRE